ncbi:CD209 antigen-like protein E isoform X1 [Mobula hypostoma]|uniref:CD209 antigen-like protein E isoform X1 n=1 Tax=Mobula hypostoma TaxID=723540 RepID=UPI002FC2D0A9
MSEQNLYENSEYQLKEYQQRTTNGQKPVEDGAAGTSIAKKKKVQQIIFGLLVLSLLFSLLCLIIGTVKNSMIYSEMKEQQHKLMMENSQLKSNDSAIYSEMKELQDKLMMEISQLKSNVSEVQRAQSILASKLPELKINNHFWTPCPKIWATFNQSCYYFSSSSGDWHFAKQKCSMLGSHLLVINNIEEQIFIKKLSVPKMYWIGLSDSAEERHWQWEDGTEYDSTPHFWASGEPNDAFNNEDCAHLDDKGQWNDINCSTKHNWICEKNSV